MCIPGARWHFLLLLVCCSGVFGQSTGEILPPPSSPSPTPSPCASSALGIVPLAGPLDFFPVATQFSAVPSGPGWRGEDGPLSEAVMRATVDNIRAHGFTGIEGPTRRPPEEERFILEYAQAQGMFISWHAGALEGFGRDAPPDPSVYTAAYGEAVDKAVAERLTRLGGIPRLYNVFTYQDEPFTAGPKTFSRDAATQAEFFKRHGYALPENLEAVRGEPRKWQELLDFHTAKFPDAWRQVYAAIKAVHPGFKVTLTHDSHNTFGGGFGSHAEIAIDDVFHWGGDFADLFMFDLYPYMMFDFRFGEFSRLPLPRISQTHYAFGQMRALTRAYGKELGFWFGTYNPAWFGPFLCPELAAMHWAEREMSATAVAAGANYLLTGYGIPIDGVHWESLGKGLRLIQKAGGRLLSTPKVQAKACMLFPRSQYLQLQEEYFNAGLSFELFLRAFGELDILHEEQIVDETLGGYEVLVLFDVKLLPRLIAQRIMAFVERGGVVVADCVPQLDENRAPLAEMAALFGVERAETGRIVRAGSWVPYKTQPGVWFSRPADAPGEVPSPVDRLPARGWEEKGLPKSPVAIVSPRACVVSTGKAIAHMASGLPALVYRAVGKGHAYLLGFCVQDTYFQAWQDQNAVGREELGAILAALFERAGVVAHVRSSNTGIEAAVRANQAEGYLFAINHEAPSDTAEIRLTALGAPIQEIVDLDSNTAMPFTRQSGTVVLDVAVPFGEARLFRLGF